MKKVHLMLIAFVSLFARAIRGSEEKVSLVQRLGNSVQGLVDLLKSKEPKEDEGSEDDKKEDSEEEKKKKAEKAKKDAEFAKGKDKDSEKSKEKSEKEEGKEDDEVTKSFESAVAEHSEIIDANEILKSFVNVLGKQSAVIARLEKKLDSQEVMMKSIASTIVDSSLVLKSSHEVVEAMSKMPIDPKGKIQADIQKSLKGKTIAQVRDIVMKSFQAGEIDASAVGRWEMNGYNPEVLPEAVRTKVLA